MTPRVDITYCTQCQWLLRAAWLAQELLSTFATELGEVALIPGAGGVFEIRVDGQLVAPGGGSVSRSQGNQATGARSHRSR